jgi:hypothetical protein
MTVKVMFHDGSAIYPSYDPEHRKSILEFYANLFDKGEIMGWEVLA